MMKTFFPILAAALWLAATSGAGFAQTVKCGVFKAEWAEVTFTLTGGGTWKPNPYQTITVQDTFTGTVTFSRILSDDECSLGVDRVGPYTLNHKEEWRNNEGKFRTVEINETVDPPGAALAVGINSLNGTWLFHPNGFFNGKETSNDGTVALTNFPFAPASTMIPNLPIPPGGGTISVDVRPPPGTGGADSLVWRAEVSIVAGKRPPVYIDPCWIYFASRIGCEQQSLGESVPLIGIPFGLHYQSDRFEAAASTGWHPRSFSLAGWSLAVHHSWDPKSRTLYLGDGSRRIGQSVRAVPAGALGPAGAIIIAGRNGDEAYLFDATGRHLRTFDTATGALRYEFSYNAAGSLTGVRDPFSRAITIERDSADRPAAIIAPNGERTTLEVNPAGLLARVVNLAGGAYQLQYSAEGWLTSFSDPLSLTSRFTYDAVGRLLRDDSPGRSVTLSRAEGPEGTTVTVTDGGIAGSYFFTQRPGESERSVGFPDGTKTSTQTSGSESTITMRDGATFRVAYADNPALGATGVGTFEFSSPGGVTRSASSTTTLEPAADGNPLMPARRVSETIVDGQVFRWSYERESRVASLTTPANRTFSTQYNANGQPTTMSRGGLASARLSYDATGRLTDVRSGDGAGERRIRLEYDDRGRIRSATDAAGRVRLFTYDNLNRLTGVGFAGAETRYSYDAIGRVTAIRPPGRPDHRVTYTPASDVAAYVPPAVGKQPAAQATYDYTAAGTLAAATRLDGRTVRITRDRAGRIASATTSGGILRIGRSRETGQVSEVTSPSGVTKQFTRDAALVTAVNYAGAVKGRTEFQFGPSARLIGVAVPDLAVAYSYSYDGDGLLTAAGDQQYARNQSSGLLTSSSVGIVRADWTYNPFGEPVSHVERAGDRMLFRAEYTRDALGRIVAKTETVGGETETENYQYDDAGRLTRVARGAREVARYTYDANGNRTQVTDARGAADAAFDEQDRLLTQGSVSYTYSPHGELLSRRDDTAITSFVFDELSELRSVRMPGGRYVEYLADEDGRRVGRRVDKQLRDIFLYHPDGAPLAWLDGAGTLKAYFIYGRRWYVPDSMVKDGVPYRIITDSIGSVRLVVNTQSGDSVQQIDYDPFGRVLRDTNPGFQPFGFAGGILDQDTGLVRMGVRDYDPDSGRFISKDPLFFSGGSTNLYQYAANDPVNGADPTGLFFGAIAGNLGGSIEISVGYVSVGLIYQPGVGLSGSVGVGVGSPGITVSGSGTPFVPVDAGTGSIWDIMNRDAKVTLEGKAGASIGDFGGVSVGLVSEELQDKYGYYCGEFSKPVPKAEICLGSYCIDTKGEMKGDATKTKKLVQKKGESKFEAGVEAGAKLEFLIFR